MAPPPDTSDVTVTTDAMLRSKPIATIVIIIAMQTEALPLVNTFRLSEDTDSPFPDGVPWVRYHGMYKDLNINILWPGKDPVFGVDSVGTVSVSLLTYASIQALKPDLIINAGTAGGFKAKGANVFDCYIASEVAFHDRRNPNPSSKHYSIGLRKSLATPNIINALNLKVGKLSTGDSLDMSLQDEVSISANDAVIKDMEGAAIAYVAAILSIPTVFIKAVTDIVDGDKPTSKEFLCNLKGAAAVLCRSVAQVVDFINGRCLENL